MFWELLVIQGGRIRWRYWDIPLAGLQHMATRYNISQLMDWTEPYSRALSFMKIFLETITSYLSNGNIETPMDTWLNDAEEGNKVQERLDLIAADGSSMGAMKKMAICF